MHINAIIFTIMNFYVFSFDACTYLSGKRNKKTHNLFFIACVFRRKQKNNE